MPSAAPLHDAAEKYEAALRKTGSCPRHHLRYPWDAPWPCCSPRKIGEDADAWDACGRMILESVFGRRSEASSSSTATVAGATVTVAGLGMAGVGLWARRDVERALARERIAPIGSEVDGAVVSSGAEARSLAEFIRESTLESTGGRTYAEVDAYLDESRDPIADAARAATDPRTGGPIANPDHSLWIESTALQTALMQAYMGFRLAELTIGLGGSLALTGVGIAALGRRQPRG